MSDSAQNNPGRLQAPDEQQALQFCLMIQAGLPPEQAILYFLDIANPLDLAKILQIWQRSKTVQRAQRQLMGKDWTEMSLHERMEKALDQHYAALAYLLYSTNYVNASSQDKAKLDSARTALEAKIAGTAGRSDPLSQFFEDLKSGKLKKTIERVQ